MNKPLSILILGAGSAGLRCAIDLADREKADCQITLVDKSRNHEVRMSLPKLVTGTSEKLPAAIPIKQVLKDRNINFLNDIVTHIDPIQQKVSLHTHGKIGYDYLVIALGGVPAIDTKSFDDPGIPLYSSQNAIAIRQAIAHHITRSSSSHVAIIGGGPTGVQFANELAQNWHNIAHTTEIHNLIISLFEANGRLLSENSQSVSDKAAKQLQDHGVRIYLGKKVVGTKKNSLILDDKRSVPYDVLVFAAGTMANPLLQKSGFENTEEGLVKINPYLQASGYSKVYTVGESAFAAHSVEALDNMPIHASKMGAHAAHNIIRQIRDQKLVAYEPLREAKKTGISLPIVKNRFNLHKITHWFHHFNYLLGLLPLSESWSVLSRHPHARKPKPRRR